jgi:hypothetical protein
MAKRTTSRRNNPESLPTPAGGQLRSPLSEAPVPMPEAAPDAGLGAESAGQSGDTMGLEREEISGPESVEELSEEGQDYEAEIIGGVEDAPDADQGGVRTHRYVAPETPWGNEGES